MKQLAIVIVKEGIWGLISRISKVQLSRALSNLAEKRLDGVFILATSDTDLRMSRAIENEHLQFVPKSERPKVSLCSYGEGYSEEFFKFIATLEYKKLAVIVYSEPSLKAVIYDNLNLHLEKLRDSGVDCLPCLFTK